MKYPADRTVQWPSGPVNTCEKHGNALIALGGMLGSNVVATKLLEPAECLNCVNENPDLLGKEWLNEKEV